MSCPDWTSSNEVERAHLSKWLKNYREGTIELVEAQELTSEKAQQEEKEEKEQGLALEAKVIPSFRGWRGKTVFRLDNGTTWQQRMPGTMYYSGTSSDIVISRNMMGRYVLRHVETDRSVLVKRLE